MRQFVSDLVLFAWTILTAWAAYLTGGIVTGGVWLFERLTDNRLSKRAVIGLYVIVFLIVAFFLAWRDQLNAVRKSTETNSGLIQDVQNTKEELKETKRQLDFEREQSKPKLVADIDYVALGDDPKKNVVQAFIILRVRNIGAASVVEGPYRLQIRAGDVSLDAMPTFIPEGWTASSDQWNIKFTRAMAFEDKATKPLDRGGMIAGWLRYVLEGVKLAQLHKVGTLYTISFVDVLGQSYAAAYTITKEQSDPTIYYNPGAGAPFQYPKKMKPKGH